MKMEASKVVRLLRDVCGDQGLSLWSSEGRNAFLHIAACSLLLFFASCSKSNQETAPKLKDNGQLASEIAEYMTAYYENGLFSGSILVAANGRIIHRAGYGLANREWQIPNTPSTKFRLASLSKQFTAAAIMKLVDEGKVQVDSSVSSYLPFFRKDIGEQVSVHKLLSHISGLTLDYQDLPNYSRDILRNPYTLTETLALQQPLNLEFEPGTQFSYSNYGFIVLAAIIESVAGKTYGKVLKEKLFEPAGMGLDSYKPQYHIDILSEERQAQVKKIVQLLEAYEPTKIAIELRTSRQVYLDSLYKEYLAGNFELKSNEVYQLGFRLARRLRHEKVYAVDVKGRSYFADMTQDEYDAKVQKLDREDLRISEWNKRYRRFYSYGTL